MTNATAAMTPGALRLAVRSADELCARIDRLSAEARAAAEARIVERRRAAVLARRLPSVGDVLAKIERALGRISDEAAAEIERQTAETREFVRMSLLSRAIDGDEFARRILAAQAA